MAKKPLRVLAFGYTELSLEEWEQKFEGSKRKDFEASLNHEEG